MGAARAIADMQLWRKGYLNAKIEAMTAAGRDTHDRGMGRSRGPGRNIARLDPGAGAAVVNCDKPLTVSEAATAAEVGAEAA